MGEQAAFLNHVADPPPQSQNAARRDALKYGFLPVANIAAGKSRSLRTFGQRLVITFCVHSCAGLYRYVLLDFTAKAVSARKKRIHCSIID